MATYSKKSNGAHSTHPVEEEVLHYSCVIKTASTYTRRDHRDITPVHIFREYRDRVLIGETFTCNQLHMYYGTGI